MIAHTLPIDFRFVKTECRDPEFRGLHRLGQRKGFAEKGTGCRDVGPSTEVRRNPPGFRKVGMHIWKVDP
jgi:hypothetical protein